MDRIIWDQKFTVGNDRIDFEHKIFLELISIIQEKSDQGISLKDMERNIIELEYYARFHFFSEENIMIDIGYPEYEEHRKHHFNLLEELNTSKHLVLQKKMPVGEFIDFLFTWFRGHTVVEDHKIVEYLNRIQ